MTRGRRLLLGCALAAGACGSGGRPGTPPRHAVLVTVSALRADHVTGLGYPRPTTSLPEPDPSGPDLSFDGLAAGGVVFARAFAPAAADGPALASLLTGRRLGASPASDAPALAEAFAQAGFRTAAFVTGEAAAPPAAGGGLLRGFQHVVRGGGADPDYEAVRGAVTWLREVAEPSGERFFLWLHLSGPAAPYEPAPLGGEDFAARFVDPDYAGGLDGSAEALARLADPEVPLDGLDLYHAAALYDAEIARAAHLVRQFATALAGRFDLLPRDLLAESALVLAGTRGADLFQHGRAAEDPSSLLDASLHVPLALRHPASMTGRRVLAETVELADVAPTLRAWLGLPPDPAPDAGRSLLDLTDRGRRRRFPSRPLLLRRPGGGSVRSDGWHLVVDGDERRLFHPAEDALERFDLAERRPDRVRELEQLLRE